LFLRKSFKNVSELLVGVYFVNSEVRRNQQKAFEEGILTLFPVLDFSTASAQIHAELYASLRQKGDRGLPFSHI
jgi:predicted nucleic acid-binding protein